MPRSLAALVALSLLASSGCWLMRPPTPADVPPQLPNPLFVATTNRDLMWDIIVDVVDDDFQVAREERPRLLDDVLIEGRLQTRPQTSATIFEPHKDDSVTRYDRVESTLQSIRRTCYVRAIPEGNGYAIQVEVLKELLHARRPAFAVTSVGTFNFDDSLRRFEQEVTDVPVAQGWIPQGNDFVLEQKILAKIQEALNAQCGP